MKTATLVLTFLISASAASAGSVLPRGNYRPRFDPPPASERTTSVAFHGHDVVAFRSTGMHIKGDARFAAKARDGRTYLFVSEEHRTAFLRNPEQFAAVSVR